MYRSVIWLGVILSVESQFVELPTLNFQGVRTGTNRQLSGQQQGHILSDIQQHQHRFNVHQSLLNNKNIARENPQQQRIQNVQQFRQHNQNGVGTFQNPLRVTNPQDVLLQSQLRAAKQNQQYSVRNQLSEIQNGPQYTVNTAPLINIAPLINTAKHPVLKNPTLLSQQNPGIQQLITNVPDSSFDQVQNNPQTNAQGVFFNNPPTTTRNQIQISSNLRPTATNQQPITSNFRPTVTNQQPITSNFRPTVSAPVETPLFHTQQTSRQNVFYDPEREQQRLKDLEAKQQIIDKHNQFIEKQYEKALKKVQADHQKWVNEQTESRTKLYKSLYRPDGSRVRYPTQARARYVYPEEVPLFEKAVQKYYEEHPTTTTTTTTEAPPTTEAPEEESVEEQKDEPTKEPFVSLFLPTALPPEPKPKPIKSIEQLDQLQKQYKQQQLQREDLLVQLKQALAESPESDISKNFTSREISLPNGQRVQLISTGDKDFAGASSIQSQIEDQEKYIELEAPLPSAKPPNLILEELTKGVIPPGADFELLKHNEGGNLELEKHPASLNNQKKVTFVLLEEQSDGSYKVQGVKGNSENEKGKGEVDVDSILQQIKDGDIKLPPSNYKEQREQTASTDQAVSTATFVTVPPSLRTQPSTQSTHSISYTPTTTYPSTEVSNFKSPSTARPDYMYTTTQRRSSQSPEVQPMKYFLDILKNDNLYAMVKFLKQSGLETILNETGPYTIFVPTDNAFRMLLIQLGGPDKAEEKFEENPRLLSGLLLHHVIPGAFNISSLQDEMTGVSLAGTQLRVNQYNMEDAHWNDVKTTTINGATILADKQDIQIPQGIAHAVDRVMFPLPVGDMLQTLRSDREKRFGSFLRVVAASGLSDTLQGPKVYTLFAPTDKAFSNLSAEEFKNTTNDEEAAKSLVLRHLIPGSLYTSGMRYYQVIDTMQSDNQITVTKQGGRIKINNNVSMVTQNIPTTNGVIHAVDTLL